MCVGEISFRCVDFEMFVRFCQECSYTYNLNLEKWGMRYLSVVNKSVFGKTVRENVITQWECLVWYNKQGRNVEFQMIPILKGYMEGKVPYFQILYFDNENVEREEKNNGGTDGECSANTKPGKASASKGTI